MTLYAYNAAAQTWLEHAVEASGVTRILSTQSPAAVASENVYEPAHAVSVASLATHHGTILARVVDNGRRIELNLLNLFSAPECPSVTFAFPDVVLQAGLTADTTSDAIFLLALTQTGKLLKLGFNSNTLWFDEAWEDHLFEAQVQAGEDVRGLHVLDADSVLVSCKDGSLIKITQARAAPGSATLHEDSWTDVALSAKTSWSLWSTRQPTSADESDASAVISMASITNQRGILDVAFTVSRDKKLRLWSLHRDKLINSFDLSQLLASSSAEHGSATEALYSDHQQPLVRVVLSTSLADQHAAYLILYTAQSGLANAFLIFAITLNDSGEVDALVPLGSKTVPDSLAAAELVDFQIAHINPALAVPTPTWVLWTQWQIAGAQHMVFIPLSEISTGTMQITQGEEAEDQWMPVLPSFEDGWSAEAFEERLAAQAADGQIGQEDVSRVFVKHIFEPARYAPSTLVAAYESYAASLESLPDFDELASVADRIVETVGYSVQLVSSTTTGAPLVDDYIAELKSEWLRFLALLNESKAAALFPLALSCDPRTLTVYAHSRNAITVPVVQDEALTLQRRVEHVAGETDEGFLTIAERTFHSSYPHLASMTTRRPILQLASIARTLWAVLPAEVALEIETQLVATVCSPLVLAAEDVTTDLYDRLLQDSLVDHRDALLSQMQEVPNLTEGLGTYLQLLASGDWAGFPESTVEEGLPTKLGTSLATSTVQQGAKARYTAVLELLVLLLAAYAEEDSLFPSSSQQLNAAFSCFHSLHLLKWITECIEPPVARADPDTSTEILAKRFGDLGMQHKQADREMAWSLLSSLLSDPKYMPLLSAAPATSLIQAASSFLGYLELLPAAAQIDTKDGLVVLAYRLLEFGLPQQALDLVHKLPQNEGLAYEAGRALLQIGQPDEAASFVIRASIALEEPEALTSLATIVPQQLCSAIPFFYHSALLFSEQADTEAAVARLCSAAIDHIERGQSTAEDTVKDLWSLLFKSQVETGDFDLAFSTLVDIPLADLQSDCLRLFITALCDVQRIDLLLQFPFTATLRNELESQLEFRARNTDPRAVPSFSKVIYSFQISRGDFRSAATVMYLHARRLGEVALREGEFEHLVTERCQAYLAAINALSLVSKADAWIASPFSTRRKRTIRTCKVPEESFSRSAAPELAFYDLDDLQQEYLCTLARLDLSAAYPELAKTAADLDASFAVALYSQAGRYDKAFAVAHACDIGMASLFENITAKCLAFSKETSFLDSTWIYETEDVARWTGSNEAKAWLLLDRYLERYDKNGAYRERVLDLVLAEELPVIVPSWLSAYFLAHNPDFYGIKLFEHGYVDESMRFAFHQLEEASKSKGRESSNREPQCWALVDQLLLVKSEEDAPVDMELQGALQKAVEAHFKSKGRQSAVAGR